jgi:uncharacterized protein (TIGR02996 family)
VDRNELVRRARKTGDDAELRVYADWLEQHGDPTRAQLVHMQCELARTGRHERRAVELEWEIAALLAAHGDAWRGELPELPGVTWTDFDRGAVTAAKVTSSAVLIEQADAIAAAAPIDRVELGRIDHGDLTADLSWLRAVEFTDNEPEIAELDGLHDVAPFERLTIRDSEWCGRELAESLARSEWAPELRALELTTTWVRYDNGYADDPRLRAEGAAALRTLVGLERLVIDKHECGAAIEPLVKALPKLRSLSARESLYTKPALAGAGASFVELDLGRNALGSAGAVQLAKSKRLAELEVLVLDTCELESVGLAALIAAPMWQTLRAFDVSRNPLATSGARALAEAPEPAKLHTLSLADCDLDDKAALALAKVPWLGRLLALDLSGNILGAGAATALRALPADTLRKLVVRSIGLGRTEAAALARFWPHLVTLDLGGNSITDAGLERFVAMKEAAALHHLVLATCQLRDDGLDILAAAARCPRLRTLDLSGNAFGVGLAPFLASRMMANVEVLRLRDCGLAGAAIAAIAEAAPPRLRELDLRGNELDQQALVALADSASLRGVAMKLEGAPWTFPEPVRAKLAQRFGVNWFQRD